MERSAAQGHWNMLQGALHAKYCGEVVLHAESDPLLIRCRLAHALGPIVVREFSFGVIVTQHDAGPGIFQHLEVAVGVSDRKRRALPGAVVEMHRFARVFIGWQ